MKIFLSLSVLFLIACNGSMAQNAKSDTDFIWEHAIDVQWVPDANFPGLSRATLVGDPSEPGLYIIRVRFAAGVLSPPHYHDQARHVVVISGTWAMGMGDSRDCDTTVPLSAGDHATHPIGAIHYDGSCNGEETVVQVTGMGPVKTTRSAQ